MQRRNTMFSSAELVLSFIGAGIAGTIYWAHAHNVDLPCSTGNGCDLVAASRWAHIADYPVALLGFFGYSALMILSVLKLTGDLGFAAKMRSLMLLISGCGFAYSWYLQYVSHVYIGAICSWCMTSAITMTVLFFVTLTDLVGEIRVKTNPATA